jgi:hypothetical protein
MHEHDETEESPVVSCEHWRCDHSATHDEIEEGTSGLYYLEGQRWTNTTEGWFCEEHLIYCEDCGNNWHQDNVAFTGSHRAVCEDCREHYGSCEQCGEIFCESELEWHDNDDCYYCDDCYSEHVRPPRNVGRCQSCGTEHVHLDLLTEQFVCDCKAATIEIGLVMRRETMKEILTNA